MQKWEDYIKEFPDISIIEGDHILEPRSLEAIDSINKDGLNHSFQNKEYTLETMGPFIDEKENVFSVIAIVKNTIENLYGIIQPIKKVVKIFKKNN